MEANQDGYACSKMVLLVELVVISLCGLCSTITMHMSVMYSKGYVIYALPWSYLSGLWSTMVMPVGGYALMQYYGHACGGICSTMVMPVGGYAVLW